MKTGHHYRRNLLATSGLTELGSAGRSLFEVPAMALEPRFMFDAAGAATGLEAAQDNEAERQAQAAVAQIVGTPIVDEVVRPSQTIDSGGIVVFVDRSVDGYESLVAGIASGAEVIYLDSDRGGLSRMAQALEGRSGISAIHILSHGGVGEIILGSDRLNAETLDDHAQALSVLRAALSENGDVLLYGCSVAANGEGQAFVEALSETLAADVAASDDLSGSAAQGGDWVLETQIGYIEATSPFSQATLDAFRGVLDTTAPVLDLDTSSPGLDYEGPLSDIRLGAYVTDPSLISLQEAGTISEVRLSLGGAGHDAANDELRYVVTRLVDGGSITVSGVVWSVSISGSDYILSTAGASVANVLFMFQNLQMINDQTVAQSGIREVTIEIVDSSGNVSAPAVSRVDIDGQPPTLDPDTSMPNWYDRYITESDLQSGFQIVNPDLLEVTEDRGFASITFLTGADFPNPPTDVEELYVDDTQLTAGLDFDFEGVTWTVTTAYFQYEKRYVLTTDAGPSAEATKRLIESVTWRNTQATPTPGTRWIQMLARDIAGNNSETSAVRFWIDEEAPVLDLNTDLVGLNHDGGLKGPADIQAGVALVESGKVDLTETNIVTVMTLTLSGAGHDAANDQLLIDGTLLTDGGSVTVNGVTWSVAKVGSVYSLSLGTAGTTAANAELVLEGLVLRNQQAAPQEGTRSVSVQVTDGAGSSSLAASANFDLDATAPTLDLDTDVAGADYDGGFVELAEIQAGINLAESGKIALAESGTITEISLVISDIGHDAANDQLLIGATVLADGGSVTVNGVTWSVGKSGSGYTLSTAGTTTANAELVLEALTLRNQQADPQEGARSINVQVTDGLGNRSLAASTSFDLDVTAPAALDLDADEAGVQIEQQNVIDVTELDEGVTLIPAPTVPSEDDMAVIEIELGGGGFTPESDQLILEELKALTTDFDGQNTTIGGVTGVDYGYDGSSRTLIITSTGGGGFTPTQISDIVRSIGIRGTDLGLRTASFTYVDEAGNRSDPATVALLVEGVLELDDGFVPQEERAEFGEDTRIESELVEVNGTLAIMDALDSVRNSVAEAGLNFRGRVLDAGGGDAGGIEIDTAAGAEEEEEEGAQEGGVESNLFEEFDDVEEDSSERNDLSPAELLLELEEDIPAEENEDDAAAEKGEIEKIDSSADLSDLERTDGFTESLRLAGLADDRRIESLGSAFAEHQPPSLSDVSVRTRT